jgi:hypothetical protein
MRAGNTFLGGISHIQQHHGSQNREFFRTIMQKQQTVDRALIFLFQRSMTIRAFEDTNTKR